jgi:hypothetical protein
MHHLFPLSALEGISPDVTLINFIVAVGLTTLKKKSTAAKVRILCWPLKHQKQLRSLTTIVVELDAT